MRCSCKLGGKICSGCQAANWQTKSIWTLNKKIKELEDRIVKLEQNKKEDKK